MRAACKVCSLPLYRPLASSPSFLLGCQRSSSHARQPSRLPAPFAPSPPAAVLFSVWQQVDFDWQRYGGWPFLVGMVCEWHLS